MQGFEGAGRFAAVDDSQAPRARTGIGAFADLRADVRRAGGLTSLVHNRALFAVVTYRLGRALLGLPVAPRRFALLVHRPLELLTEIASGVELPVSADIGPGLYLPHAGTVVVHEGVRAGRNLTLLHGTTLGNAEAGGDPPVLGDNVAVLVNASVFGPIHVGDGARIAPHAVVLNDVAAQTIVGGIPAKPLSSSARPTPP